MARRSDKKKAGDRSSRARTLPTKKKGAKAAGGARRVRRAGGGEHPALVQIRGRLPPGSYAGGLVLLTAPGALDEELAPWLLGKLDGRHALGRTAFGDFLVFRDLRARARALDLPDADHACDAALVDIHTKRMTVVAHDVETFVLFLDDVPAQRRVLRRSLFDEARARLGLPAASECFAFVPALALGGAEDASAVQRVDWRVHQALLLQL